MTHHLYAVALGSNRPHGRHGRPAQVVSAAVDRLAADYDLIGCSPTLLNPAAGGAGRDFANAVVLIETSLAPPALLGALKGIEREFGRRGGRRWGPRVLDLDIIAWDGGHWRSRSLTIPHPQLARRAFVIEPLASLAPAWRITHNLTPRHLAHRLARRTPRD